MVVRVGVVGAGYWGPNLIRSLSGLPNARLTQICDLDQAKLDKLAPQYRDARLTQNFNDLLNDPETDAIAVALPASLHFEFTLKALEAGKHCLVEKPLATSSQECRDLISAAEKRGLVLMVGHTFEYNAAVRKLREYVDSGELGDVLHIFSQRLNLGQVRSDVDAMWNLAPHDFSIAIFLMKGEAPVAVSARGFSFVQANRGINDVCFVTLEFASGPIAHVVVSWLSPEKIRKIMLVGSKKMAVFDDVSIDAKVQLYEKGIEKTPTSWDEHGSYGEYQCRVRTGDMITPNIRMTEPLKAECSHFIDCIVEGKTPLTDGGNGLRVTQILEAASLSMARQGARIVLSDI